MALQPIQITQKAIGNYVQQIALELNCDDSTVYRYCGHEENDPYTRFCAVHRVTAKVNPDGAELYFQDFQARHLALRNSEILNNAGWDEALGEAMQALAEAVRLRGAGGPEFCVKVASVVRHLEWLLRQQAR